MRRVALLGLLLLVGCSSASLSSLRSQGTTTRLSGSGEQERVPPKASPKPKSTDDSLKKQKANKEHQEHQEQVFEVALAALCNEAKQAFCVLKCPPLGEVRFSWAKTAEVWNDGEQGDVSVVDSLLKQCTDAEDAWKEKVTNWNQEATKLKEAFKKNALTKMIPEAERKTKKNNAATDLECHNKVERGRAVSEGRAEYRTSLANIRAKCYLLKKVALEIIQGTRVQEVAL